MPSPRYNEKTALKEIERFQSKIDNIDKRNPNKSHYEAVIRGLKSFIAKNFVAK